VLDHDDLVLGLGLVWTSGDVARLRRAMGQLDPARVATDPSRLAVQEAAR
jgi:hypothetical protein